MSVNKLMLAIGVALGALSAPMTLQARSLVTPQPASVAATQLAPLIDTTADGSLTRGVMMYADRNYIGAVSHLADALRCLSGQDECSARLYLALATLGIPGRADDGAALLEEFLADYPTAATRARAELALAGYHFDRGDYAVALRIYKSVDPVTLDGAMLDIRDYYMAYCLLKVADYDKAQRIYDRLAGTREYGDAARFYAAYIAYSRRDYDRALKLFDAVNTSAAPGSMADYYRAQIYYNRRDWNHAYNTANRLINNYSVPDEYLNEAVRVAGEAAYNLDRRDKAHTLLRRYVDAAGDAALPSARYALGVCLYERDDIDGALEQLTAATELDNIMGQSASLYVGQCYLRRDNYDAAMLAFQRATRLDFDSDISETAFYNYAVARSKGGRTPFGSSVSVFEEFLERYPSSRYDTEVRRYLAYGYMADENYAAALRSIERIADKSPELQLAHQQILYNLGARRLTAGDLRSADDLLTRATEVRGGDADVTRQATLWLADCRYRQGRYADAVRLYDSFIKSARKDTPNQAQARYGLGYALFDNKEYKRAAEAFDRYLSQAPAGTPASTLADAECRLGDIAFQASDFGKAAERYRQAAERYPEGGDYPLYQQALIHGYHSRYADKTALLTRLLTEYPRSARVPSALLEMAESYRLAGDPASALNTYERLISTYPSMPQGRNGMLLAAQLHLNRGERSDAIDLYKRLVHGYPTSDEARSASDALRDLYAADGELDSYVAFIKSVPNAPAVEPTELDRIAYEAAEHHYLSTGDVTRVSKYLEQHPDGQYRAAALLCEANAALAAGDDETALNRATAVATAFADSPQAPRALLIKSTVEARTGRDADALATLEQLTAKAPDAATLDAARMGVMRAALRLGRLDRVISAAHDLEGSSSLTPADRLEVDYTHALALCRRGDHNGAEALWKEAAAQTDELYGVMSAYRLGQMYLDDNRLRDASRVANALVDSNTPHEYWLAKGFILLSDVLRTQGDTFEANEYLRSLRDNYPGTEADIFADIDARLK